MAAKKIDPNRCSLNEAERWLGVTRQTLSKWLDRGAPVVERPETKGKPILVSVPELYAWSIKVVEEEAEKKITETVKSILGDANADPSKMTKEEADRRKAVAAAIREEIKAFDDSGKVIPINEVEVIVSKYVSPVREILMGLHKNLPEKLERRTTVPARISANLIRKEVDEALEAISKKLSFAEEENEDIPTNGSDQTTSE